MQPMRWMLCALAAALLAFPAQARHGGAKPQTEIAITFDDLPAHGPLPAGVTRADVAHRIVRALRAHHVPPVYGFINGFRLEQNPEDAEVFRIWRAAGNMLGSHTYSHMDANKNPASAFEQDIVADEPLLQKYMAGQDWHWLRLPYLDEGDTPEKRKEIADYLDAHGYRIAPVTLDFDDYAFNEPYARCMAKGDLDAIEWLSQFYLDRASVELLVGSQMSEKLYGRNIKHILLMHIGAFDSVMLPKLLDLYAKRGVRFISLPDAERDPAYKDGTHQQFDWGGTMLAEQMVAHNIPIPPYVNSNDDLKKLDAVCK